MTLRTTLCSISLLLASTTYAGPTGNPFYGDPPDEHHPWAIHDQNRPQPKLVTPPTPSLPDKPGQPPSDAVVLFDGTDKTLSNWEADTREGGPTKWVVKDGAMECVPKSGYVRTRQQFSDCQLHVEWAAPKAVQGESQGRGNSGVFLMGLVEVQVLDNVNNPTYADGFAASVYGVNPPAANALHNPGEFNSYDIIFRRPVYKDGKVLDPGYVTVFENGVCVQDHTQLEGGTGHMRRSKAAAFPEKGSLKLQDHGNPVRYRNIWYRELPKRSVEGGTDGPLTAEATAAKRKEIAAAIRADADKLPANSVNQLLRYAESLSYDMDEATAKKVEQAATDYANGIKQLPADKVGAKKDEVKRVQSAFAYLTKFKILPADYAPKAELDKIVKANNWDQPNR
jgi:hypothetical protein